MLTTVVTEPALLSRLAPLVGRKTLPAIPIFPRSPDSASGAGGQTRLLSRIRHLVTDERAREQLVAPTPRLSVSQSSSARPALLTIETRSRSFGAVTCYTLDGRSPTVRDTPYRAPVPLTGNTAIRARTFVPGRLPSECATVTCLLDRPRRLDTVSLILDPKRLDGRLEGIRRYYGRRGRRWEQPAVLQLLDTSGTVTYESTVGVRIHGRSSRVLPKKAYRLYWREAYGRAWFDVDLFGEPTPAYHCLILDSGRRDEETLVADLICDVLARQVRLTATRFRPCVLLINGANQGIYFLRERIDEHFLRDQLGIEDADLLDAREVRLGSFEAWRRFETFFATCDPTRENDWRELKRMVDLESFTEHRLLNIVLNNIAWRFGNEFRVRDRAHNGPWRWLAYDMDRTFNLGADVDHNQFPFALLEEAPWKYGPDSQSAEALRTPSLLKVLLRRPEYRNFFLQRLADRLNSTYAPENLVKTIDEVTSQIREDYAWEARAWSKDSAAWERCVSGLHSFAQQRSAIVFSQAVGQFQLRGLVDVCVTADPTEGRVFVNSLPLPQPRWRGKYFQGVPLQLRAIAHPGYHFSHWRGSTASTRAEVTVVPWSSERHWEAVFVPATERVGSQRVGLSPLASPSRVTVTLKTTPPLMEQNLHP